MNATLDDKVLTGVQAVELGNIARECENITSPSSRYDIQAAADKLHQLGLISDADHIQFERYYKECALVDAAKVLVPPGYRCSIQQWSDGWEASLSAYDNKDWILKDTIGRGRSITEHHARTAAALRAWGKVTV
jgi:hypothetical protein